MQEGPKTLKFICNECNYLNIIRKNDGHGGIDLKYICKKSNLEIKTSQNTVSTPSWCIFLKEKY